MNILLVSECSGAARVQTRRILDQFSERRGEGVWQTVITQAGLDTLRKLLRRTARKNTAVACYRMYGARTELLWIAGATGRFGPQGVVPTNRTRRDILRAADENNWHSLPVIALLARLAALWHDVGKACAQFQQMLRSRTIQKSHIRHEWITLRLFEAFVGSDDDAAWLDRLSIFDPGQTTTILKRIRCDELLPLKHTERKPFSGLPPLAQAVAWLILGHHRLPAYPEGATWSAEMLGALPEAFTRTWNEPGMPPPQEVKAYWNIPKDLFLRLGEEWQKRVRKCAARLLALPAPPPWDDPFVLHLARLGLMLADHRVSAEAAGTDTAPLAALPPANDLYANTGRDGNLKQTLPEHLVRVEALCGQVVYALPLLAEELPRLARHRGLQRRSADSRFRWQDKAVETCAALREHTGGAGVFLLNMASTGCGKTLANIRMLYALNTPERGMRATFALGLRVLTEQTGREYRQRLHLAEDELAVRVGGVTGRELYDLLARQAMEAKHPGSGTASEARALEADWQHLAAAGVESSQALFADQDHVLFESGVETHPAVARVFEDTRARVLLTAPVLTCTVDHLMPATESLRGGHQMLPMLRLLSGDLALDEIDDYGLDDLPAIARLICWAGMLGCRVLISSATIAPSLATGLFAAYREGRAIFQKNRGERPEEAPDIHCVWTDEFRTHTDRITDENAFGKVHATFARKRAEQVDKAPHRRAVRLLDMGALNGCSPRELPRELARVLLGAASCLHADNHSAFQDKRVSFGLLRMANIGPLRRIARAFCGLDAPEGMRIHVLVYHARFPLCVRARVEELLDRCLIRKDPLAVFAIPEIQARLCAPERDHIFLILASPVCEVGRDWDADWALVEPSSMRSLIQLAGRIRRHRPGQYSTVNLLVWSHNFKALENPGEPAFRRPGFETGKGGAFVLSSHDLNRLLLPEQYERIDSRPRLLARENLDPHSNLADLEHARLKRLFVAKPPRELTAREIRAGQKTVTKEVCAASWWQEPRSMLSGVLQQKQPFRAPSQPEADYLLLPNPDQDDWVLTAINRTGQSNQEEKLIRISDEKNPPASHGNQVEIFHWGQGMAPWLLVDPMEILYTVAEETEQDLEICARKYTVLRLPESKVAGWTFHPLLGFDRKGQTG